MTCELNSENFTTVVEELCSLGLAQEAAIRTLNGTSLTDADMEIVDEIEILRIQILNISRPDSGFWYLRTPAEYCSAAEKFGMNDLFCTALAEERFWFIVQREPVWKHISDFVEDRVISLRRNFWASSTSSPAREDTSDTDTEDSELENDHLILKDAATKRQANPRSYVSLYQGGSIDRLEGYLDYGDITPRNAYSITSSSPTDFSGTSESAVYLLKDKALATYYAMLAKRMGVRRAGVLTIWVEAAAIQQREVVVSDQSWHKLVNFNRLHPQARIPRDFKHIAQAKILSGPMSGGSQNQFRENTLADVMKMMNSVDVSNPVQYCFRPDTFEDVLGYCEAEVVSLE